MTAHPPQALTLMTKKKAQYSHVKNRGHILTTKP